MLGLSFSILGLHRDNGNEMEIIIMCLDDLGIMEKKLEIIIVYWGYLGIMENRKGTTMVCWVYSGIMEKKMETTVVVCWDDIGKFEKNKMETTIVQAWDPHSFGSGNPAPPFPYFWELRWFGDLRWSKISLTNSSYLNQTGVEEMLHDPHVFCNLQITV